MTSGQLQWTVINDFSPGIHQILSPNHPPGAAREDGTFRCRSADGGALVPLPRNSEIIYGASDFMGYEGPPGLINEEYRIVGLHARGPIYWGQKQTRGYRQDNTEIFVAVEFWRQKPADDNDWHHHKVIKYRHNQVNPTWQEIWASVKALEPYNPFNIPTYADFQDSRSNHSNPDKQGAIVLCCALYGDMFMYPDDTSAATMATDSTRILPGDFTASGGLISCVNLVGHQGRIVGFPLAVTNSGFEAQWPTNELFFWTSVNDLRTLDPALGGELYTVSAGWEDPSGYQAFAALTFDELLLIKSKGGAIIIRGSLADFTAVNLPYVRSAGFTLNTGTVTPLGFAYPVDSSGMWVWKGGEASENMTKQMNPDFWRPPILGPARDPAAVGFLMYPSQCGSWGEWTMLPNNWLWDTDFGGFWRLDDVNNFNIHRWSSDWRGVTIYGTPSGFLDASEPNVYAFDKRFPVANFEWHSQPMSVTMEKDVDVRGIILVSSGKGHVNLRCYTAEDPLGQTVTFTVTGTPAQPTIQRLDVHVQGHFFSFQLESVADDPQDAAPTIHQVRYGVREGPHVAK